MTDVLPPGPRLPGLVQALLTLSAPALTFPAAARRYGVPFSLELMPKGRSVVAVADPADVKDVFAGSPSVFHAGKGNELLRPLLGEDSLLLQDGDAHARARRLLAPAFGRREIAGYRTLVEEVTAQQLDKWPRSGRVRAHVLLSELTLEVILRVVFGVTDSERLDRMRPVVARAVDAGPVMMIGLAIPALRRLWPWTREIRDLATIHAFLDQEIDAARRDPALADRRDLLALLVRASAQDGQGSLGTEQGHSDGRGSSGTEQGHSDGRGSSGTEQGHSDGRGSSGTEQGLGDAELRDQLMTLLAAGHETTATAMAWTMLELARQPRIQDTCVAEIAGGEKTDYLEAVLKESLRLHPVVPMVMRELQEPATIGGRDYPRGMTISPSIILAHRAPAAYPAPQDFDPERFLGDVPTPTTWLPFGGGARRCIGASFAMMEGEVILRQVLQRYRLDPVGSGREWPRSRNVTLYPWRRARIELRPR
ncbi:cytochrome P450 [Rhodococcus sp. IEGM 1408]|uniref:cytochrome P450 n=1 Tax=Rhodococcus sp. IEGM 1408 TaxID=3082220 RepID=UPI002952DEFD|nr:cytochrome P450 [Rhodococcus sp. IEGM 1408]MDV8002143.1 cytochrome P450 [Rhodococcus sp. IEGM 1408]